ncbi:hypothetical protein ElyMa_006284900 [Elysia marginata]|uniref:Uncharacterized protein n=1 Tax=Elysia marginata TaxID=1093978 RepID=A0AAV4HGQ8_9GAST|nr:hypothetical protein ElyMa_006284900 [Elysia marginata]
MVSGVGETKFQNDKARRLLTLGFFCLGPSIRDWVMTGEGMALRPQEMELGGNEACLSDEERGEGVRIKTMSLMWRWMQCCETRRALDND